MQHIKNTIVIFLILVSIASNAQAPEVVKNYINTYKELAISEMQRTGVPASITLAQGIHESTAGTSKLVQASNNHFGIKCKVSWTGESVKHDDDARSECFRKYPVAEDSYKDHSNFLKNGQRYAFLFQLAATDYEGWANGLKKAGYATNPKYPQVLIKLIEEYSLQNYTLIALGKPPSRDMGAIDPVIINAEPVAPKVIERPLLVETQKPDYPEGLFLINETKVIYAKKGTSFLAIAKQYNVDLSRLFEFNEIARLEEVQKDQLIYVQRKRKTGNEEFHTVQSGETLHDIAQQQAIRLESLAELNLIKPDAIPAPGEQLNLKNKAAAMPKLAMKSNYAIIPGIK